MRIKATRPERDDIIEKLIRCCTEIEDSGKAVEVALEVLELAPDASFGKYDYLVTQAVYAQLLKQYPNLSARVATRSPVEMERLRYIANRYKNLLASPWLGPREQELTVSRLAQIQEFLDRSDEQPRSLPRIGRTPPTTQLPEGDQDQLLHATRDPKNSYWDRGLAAYALALQLDEQSKSEESAGWYRESLTSLRKVFPFTSGISTTTYRSAARGVEHPESEECELVREIKSRYQSTIADPREIAETDVSFRVVGTPLPNDLVVKFDINLRAKNLDTRYRRDTNLPHSVPVVDQVAKLTALNGVYQAEVSLHGISYLPKETPSVGRLLEFDFSKLPKQIELKGEPLQFDVPARLCLEIVAEEPSPRETIDLMTDRLRWSSVEGAAHYQLQLIEKETVVGGGERYSHGAVFKTDATSWCLGTLPEKEKAKCDWMAPGMTISWQVTAYDMDDRRIGATTRDDLMFLVGESLPKNRNKLIKDSPVTR